MPDSNIWEMSNFSGSLWSSDLMRRAKATKFLIYILLLILSGFGNIFAIVVPKVEFFNRSVNISKEYIQVFYNNDMQKYVEDLGFVDQAEKSGLIPSAKKIEEFIRSQPEFLDEKSNFDLSKYKIFLKSKCLKEYEVVDFYKKKLTTKTFKESIFLNETPEKYSITNKKLNFSILLTNNYIYPTLKIESKEFSKFLLKKLKENSTYLTDGEKLEVQYIEIKGGNKPDKESVTKFYEKLKNSNNIIRDCKNFYGTEAEVSIFVLPLGTKGRYHKLNFIFDKIYIKSDKETTIFAITKKIEARSLKETNKIDFDFLQKLYLGQITYKIRLLNSLMEPLSKREVYSVKNVTLSSLDDINFLRQKGLLFMKEGDAQVFKSSDNEVYVAILNSITENSEDKDKSELCNKFLNNTLSHNFFVNSLIEYWISRSHSS